MGRSSPNQTARAWFVVSAFWLGVGGDTPSNQKHKTRNQETVQEPTPVRLRYSEALNLALQEALREDPRVLLLGEEVASPQGGAFAVTKGLADEFGPERVMDTPISENGFVGIAVGAALAGLRPVVELMFSDFIALAADQIVNHAAKLHYMYAGQVAVPLVIRTACGGYRGYGATHSQFPAAWFANVPGLKIVAPFSPQDARRLLRWAIRDDNPVLFFEHKLLYGQWGEVPERDEVPDEVRAAVLREGGDVTVVGFSYLLGAALEAAVQLEAAGISAEVIDLRSLKPLDLDTVLASVRKTGRAVVVEEGPKTGGIGAEVAAGIAEEALPYLDGRIVRVAAADTPIPAAPALERAVLPDAGQIVAACYRALRWD
ncbi:MAG: alpha-ketoacid dehydrogenase subunit beta [Chloroflexi bacterium]|nr:alpha-ketoacid dehydrogenase subunit beta [Chloroflexota bacterium]